LEQLPTKNISGIVSTVTFSSFSKVQNDYNRLKRGIKTAVNYLMYLNLPMMVGLALVARPLVIVLLTEKWLPAVTYIQILSLAGILFPLHTMNLNVLKAQGRSDLFFRLEIFKKILTILNIAITYRWGIIALIWGQVVTSFLAYYINSYFTGEFINYGILEQIKDIFPYVLQTIFMALIVYSINFIGFSSDLILLLVQISTGMIVYFIVSLTFKLPVFFEILDLFFEHVHFLSVFKEKYFSWRKKDE
jgi:O-antigen/teichoic acid export membrane protein